jgi:hypothetical protein
MFEESYHSFLILCKLRAGKKEKSTDMAILEMSLVTLCVPVSYNSGLQQRENTKTEQEMKKSKKKSKSIPVTGRGSL